MMTAPDETIDAALGIRIKAERESRGWSLTDLAERSGVSRAMIHRVERGESSPTASLLGRPARSEACPALPGSEQAFRPLSESDCPLVKKRR